jgi:hypothetical protein
VGRRHGETARDGWPTRSFFWLGDTVVSPLTVSVSHSDGGGGGVCPCTVFRVARLPFPHQAKQGSCTVQCPARKDLHDCFWQRG